MNKLEKMGAKIISQLTINSEFGWPPDCSGLIYQPEITALIQTMLFPQRITASNNINAGMHTLCVISALNYIHSLIHTGGP